MSNLNIYDNQWIDLVFEGKNKEYGAYQLRSENSKTSIKAFFFAISFLFSISALAMLFSSFSNHKIVTNTIPPDVIIKVSNFGNNKPNEPKKVVLPLKKRMETKIKDQIKKENLKNLVVVKKEYHPQDIKTNENQKQQQTNSDLGSSTGTSTSSLAIENAKPTDNSGNGTGFESTKKDGSVSVTALDKMPLFPGGIDKFREYIGHNFEKPDFDEEKTVTVYVSFIIETDGTLSSIKILKDPGYGLGKEAIRVLSSLKTKWTAGVLNGEKVQTFYTLPITIQLQ